MMIAAYEIRLLLVASHYNFSCFSFFLHSTFTYLGPFIEAILSVFCIIFTTNPKWNGMVGEPVSVINECEY